MEYRINKKTNDKISVLGLGTGSLFKAGAREGAQMLTRAFEKGINYFDMAAADFRSFPPFGEAMAGVRDQVIYQVHFGATYKEGPYGWTTELDEIKRSVASQLQALKTDYIDYGFIHCLDTGKDWQDYQDNKVLQYIEELKADGVIRHIGASSHTPSVANTILDTGKIEMLMFSINPAFDYQRGEYAHGGVDERAMLYRRCEKEGIGISVMKAFAGGQLLDAGTSPLGGALTEYQCLQYALDKPGVVTVLPGAASMEELDRLLGFLDAGEDQKDYSVIGGFAPQDAEGKCVYCNHCEPCPAGLDIGLINKYYDLAKAGDDMAAGHYDKLDKKADDCISCGHCNDRCPFHVQQQERMQEIAAYFA
ncbi:MAG: aldo/keto reductase [Anaerovoracaceae bacterium]|jgi:predicted aldo/keto reductase-like oxidoreductase